VGDSSLTHSEPIGGVALPSMGHDNDFCWRMDEDFLLTPTEEDEDDN
jgi:hypothetical protein